jgi:hypothetical protein
VPKSLRDEKVKGDGRDSKMLQVLEINLIIFYLKEILFFSSDLRERKDIEGLITLLLQQLED